MENASWLIRARVVDTARRNVGFGETEGNNRGRFIRALYGGEGRDGYNWCAAFAYHCYARGCELAKVDVPFDRSTSAKGLTKNVGKSRFGVIYKPHEAHTLEQNKVLPGDLVCWSRGLLPWQGHVGIVTNTDGLVSFKYIAGNQGKDGIVAEHKGYYADYKLWRFAGLR